MKGSSNRQAIVRLLETQSGHLSATAVHHRLATRDHKIALSTTYSNLDALVSTGLISDVYNTQGERLFERRAEPHPHLICKRCGEVQDLAPDALSEGCLRDLEAQASALGWRLEPRQLTLVGRCPQCQTPQATKPQPNKGAQ